MRVKFAQGNNWSYNESDAVLTVTRHRLCRSRDIDWTCLIKTPSTDISL